LWPECENLSFHLTSLGFFIFKKARQNLAIYGFFQSERLGSGKTFSELHMRYKQISSDVSV